MGVELISEVSQDFEGAIRSRLDAWLAELDLLSRDPRVREFTELLRKIDGVGRGARMLSSRHGGIEGSRNRTGIPANELSSFKEDDLEDPVAGVPAAEWE